MSSSELKIVVLGKLGCGKSSLVDRYISGKFSPTYQATVGAACTAKKVIKNKQELQFNIWDTAGGQQYELMTRVYYKNAKAAIVCYDISDFKSLKTSRFWVNELLSNVENCQIYLCGTKLDLAVKDDHYPDKDLIKDYAAWFNAKVFETSAKTGKNVEELFRTVFTDFAKANPTVGTKMGSSFSLKDCCRKKGCFCF